MPMSIEIVKIQNKKCAGFTIWIDGDSEFDSNSFFELIRPLNVTGSERVFSSFGPLEFIDEVQTELGLFTYHQELDSFPGTTISSDSSELMHRILELMLETGNYHVR